MFQLMHFISWHKAIFIRISRMCYLRFSLSFQGYFRQKIKAKTQTTTLVFWLANTITYGTWVLIALFWHIAAKQTIVNNWKSCQDLIRRNRAKKQVRSRLWLLGNLMIMEWHQLQQFHSNSLKPLRVKHSASLTWYVLGTSVSPWL